MEQNLENLINKIEMEVKNLGYSELTIRQYKNTWNKFLQYSLEQGQTNVDVSLIKSFFSDLYNIDIANIDNLKKHDKTKYRSLIMLLNFDYYKEYVCRPFPKTDNIAISNYYSEIIDKYISYCENELYNYPKTLKEKKINTKRFIQFLENNNCTKITNVNFELIQNYLDSTSNKSVESRRRIFYVLRCFLKYLYIEKYLDINYSYKIPKLKNIKSKKIPTYLKTNEVKQLLDAINNDNPVNKRNYTMILIAAKLGLRISDIKNIKFENIDWENNELKIVQVKTKNPLILPLTNEIGWAIINYIKNYRPKTTSKYIFVKHKVPYGKLADANILQGCFWKYFELAQIETKENTRKGLHSLRHSFATTLLENDTPIEIISSLMGHSNTEVTNIYTKVDVKKLHECCLEVPNEAI